MKKPTTLHEDRLGRLRQGTAPAWFALAGFGTGGAALLFFTYLIIRQQPIPCDRRFLVVVVLSLSAAMASAFIGGGATAHGSLPISPDRANVVRVTAGGGIAVLVIVMALSNHFYLCESEAPASEIKITLPAEGAMVTHVNQVEWTSPFTILNHYILIAWGGDTMQHVQEPPSRVTNTRWSGLATFGEAGDPEGTPFLVSILATRERLQPGPLVTMPDDAHVSSVISVKLAKRKEVLMRPVVKAALVLGALLLLLPLSRLLSSTSSKAPKQTASAPISITSPQEGGEVPERPFVDGLVKDPKAEVWIVVHPMENSDYWVQPPVTTDKSGKWEVQIHIGRPGDVDKGKKFEIRALANPRTRLHTGDIVGGWPEARWESMVIRVFRK